MTLSRDKALLPCRALSLTTCGGPKANIPIVLSFLWGQFQDFYNCFESFKGPIDVPVVGRPPPAEIMQHTPLWLVTFLYLQTEVCYINPLHSTTHICISCTLGVKDRTIQKYTSLEWTELLSTHLSPCQQERLCLRSKLGTNTMEQRDLRAQPMLLPHQDPGSSFRKKKRTSQVIWGSIPQGIGMGLHSQV